MIVMVLLEQGSSVEVSTGSIVGLIRYKLNYSITVNDLKMNNH